VLGLAFWRTESVTAKLDQARQALRTWRCGGDEAACSDKSQRNWTQERANKLALAFGDRWQSECFPNSIWFW
jgi:hypothetical protein